MLLDLSLPALQAVLEARVPALDEPLQLYAAAARELRRALPARADFIEAQCRGEEAEDLFEIYREAWDIPRLDHGLATAADFRRGFLFTFVDRADPLARHWFFTSPEARFARRMELWSGEECTDLREGSYAELVRIIFGGGDGDASALVSPAFSAAEFAAHGKRLVEDDPGLRDLLVEISIQRGS